jgi:hypothetical protein
MEVDMTEDFRIDVLFPDEYQDFIAEIYFRQTFICLISQEHGFDNLEIEFNKYPVQETVIMPLDDFRRAMDHAIQRLFDLRKT